MSTKFEINASPTKRFFVEMLTRDIELDDAILDLLDNSVDGILRLRKGKAGSAKPYSNYWAEIKFSRSEFRITDNCGGIPPDIAESYAFRMGRVAGDMRDKNLASVGMYGIGMKRAIFKMGSSTTIESHHAIGSFRVELTPAWLKSDEDWKISANRFSSKTAPRGTMIVVKNVFSHIAERFDKRSDFQDAFIERLRTTYAFIIEKGFRVTVNGHEIAPKPLKFLFGKLRGGKAITPYMYETDQDGVHASLTVGFYKANAQDDEDDEDATSKYSHESAGWTVICNDRVVLYCDKTRMTGWGEAEVPSFHAQYNAISGVLELSSSNSSRLPLTTTKRGIDGNSELYLALKEYMREGTKFFTTYTNRWKNAKNEARTNEKATSAVTLQQVRKNLDAESTNWKRLKKGGRKFVPNLPEPEKEGQSVVVRFVKARTDVQSLGRRLLDASTAKPGDVGSAAFDFAREKA
jgi:hypothetical protein